MEQRTDVEQLGVVVQALLASAQRAEQIDPPRVMEDQRARRLADELGGLGDEPRVGDLDVSDAGGHGSSR